jgi:hypothetical protein
MFQQPERELTALERLDRISNKGGSTVQADVGMVAAYITTLEMGAEISQAKAVGFEGVRTLGKETSRRNAIEMREDWFSYLVRTLVQAQVQGQFLNRPQLIDALDTYCDLRRYKGKKGGISLDTIKRWLTLVRERDIREVAAKRSPR